MKVSLVILISFLLGCESYQIRRAPVWGTAYAKGGKPVPEPCTVVETAEGALISCPDGTTAELFHGSDGTNGNDGAMGQSGENGANGANGKDGEDGKDGKDAEQPLFECVQINP